MCATIYTIQNGNLSASIDTRGGQLRSLNYHSYQLLWQGDPAYWEESAPLLFPFCGRVKDGVYTYGDTTYPMTIHGFLSGAEMTVETSAPNSITLTLADSDATRAVYPFAFLFTVTYTLTPDALVQSVTVKAGNTPLPFSFGAHPGFNLPVGKDGFDGALLRFAHSAPLTRLEITANGLLGKSTEDYPLTDSTLPLSPDPAGDCGIFFRVPEHQRALTLEAAALPCDLSMDFCDFPVLGLWHAEGAPYLCIEPWQGLPAPDGIPTNLSTKPETVFLAPHEEKQFTLTIGMTPKGV